MIKTTSKHVIFYTEWPSNFWKTTFEWEAFGEKHTFFCTEQAFMWAKAMYFNDFGIASKILLEEESPMACKVLGRRVARYDDKMWSKARCSFMHDANYAKYTQDLVLKAKLLDPKFNGRAFVEASPTDCIWGIGLSQDDKNADNEKKWRGQNLLGKVITQVRQEIMSKKVGPIKAI